MDFELSSEQRQTKEMISEFVDNEIASKAKEIDEKDMFPTELIRKMGDLGLMGMPFPEKYNGSGLDYHSYIIGVEEISRGSGGVGTIVAAHTSLASNMVFRYGDEKQKKKYLTSLSTGEEIGAFALSEEGAGSDVLSMGTTAKKDGNEYIINGDKLWISNGNIADTIIVFAKTDPEKNKKGISSFIIRPEKDNGFKIEGTEDKLGDRGCPTAELTFKNVKIPEKRRLGKEGDGFIQALETLNTGRISIAARSIGIAKAALQDSIKYAKQREQFDRPISKFQAIQHKLADMDTKLQAAKALTHKAADKKINGEGFRKESAQAKLYASEISREVSNQAIQIHGGYGYVKGFNVERYFRDSKINEIYEGTSEIMRNTIAKKILE